MQKKDFLYSGSFIWIQNNIAQKRIFLQKYFFTLLYSLGTIYFDKNLFQLRHQHFGPILKSYFNPITLEGLLDQKMNQTNFWLLKIESRLKINRNRLSWRSFCSCFLVAVTLTAGSGRGYKLAQSKKILTDRLKFKSRLELKWQTLSDLLSWLPNWVWLWTKS